jgi:uncharacterized protein (DUF2344 family)
VDRVPERLRIRYTKRGRIRYTSQRDMARIIERGLRRSRLPIAQSQGFSPRPLLAFSLALPTGCESLAEYIDLRFAEGGGAGFAAIADPEAGSDGAAYVARALQSTMPEGIEVVSAGVLTGAEGSLQEQVTSCDWVLEVIGMGADQLSERVATLLEHDQVLVERVRKGRKAEDNLRPSIVTLFHRGSGSTPGTQRIEAVLSTKPRGVRPVELLEGIDPSLRLVRGTRTGQYETVDGERYEPLSPLGLVRAPAVAVGAQGR